MTTGKLTPRLSERLNADLEALRHENAALMASQLQSFRSDLTAIATHARDTIEADTRMFLHATSGTMQSFQYRITRWLTLAPVILLATATAVWGVATVFDTTESQTAAPVFDDEGNVRYVLQCPGLEADVPSRKNDVAAPLLLAAERIGIMLRNAAA